MVLDSKEAKLFIKVDGVVGDRRRICIFCNNSIHGAEKILETTRKLRRGPYFPQLAHLQSSEGKIDTLGRAVVCLPCFHQLLRQWNSYEMKNVPMSKRVYKHVSDKGVKNYQETRAKEIRAQAEKRAFALQTNQEHIVKTAFNRLTKLIDAQEEIIQQSEECIENLKLKFASCTKGEQWKISREIKKHLEIIAVAEARIEDEEDKEELIRRETKLLLDAYRKNQSEPNNFQGNLEHTKEKSIVFAEHIDRNNEQQVESSQSEVDSGTNMSRNQRSREHEYNYSENGGYTVVKTMRISHSENDTDNYSPIVHAYDDDGGGDVWTSLESSRGYVENKPVRDNSDWYMTTEIIHSARSNEVQSFPEDEWSTLFDKQPSDYGNQYESGENKVRSAVTWSPQRNESPNGTEWKQIKGEIVEREEQQWDETVNADDSDYETEQVYEVNERQSNDSHFRSHDISDNHHVARSVSLPSRTWENNSTAVNQPSKHEYNISSEADIDPWDMIQIEKEREKCFYTQDEHSETQDLYSSNKGGSEYYEDDDIDEYNQERAGKVILSPRRLDPNLFSQFTKSSYIPEPNKGKPRRQQSTDKTMNSYQQYNGIERRNDVRFEESSNYVPNEITKNTLEKNASYDPLEPLRKNRHIHDQHLSVEEEEWETKYLNPKRLDDARKLNFVNEQNTDIRSKYTPQHDIHTKEHRTSATESFGSKNSLREESMKEIQIERSPALRKLIKQDELISEEPIQRVITKASVQSSPWDEIESPTSHGDSGAGNKQDNGAVRTDRYVGKLDLKQWSSELERNKIMHTKSTEQIHPRNEDKERSPASFKQNSLKTTQNVREDEVVIINRNQSPKKAGDVFVLESKNESGSQERMLRPSSLKYKEKLNFSDENGISPNRSTPTTPIRIQHTVVIEDDQRTTNDNDDYLNRKCVGKINLGPWEQNTSSQSLDDNRSHSSNSRDSRSPSTMNDGGPSQFDSSQQYTNSKSKSDINAQERKHTNTTHEEGAYTDHRSFNKSMSEDELAWEKRFSKTFEREISVEEPEEERIPRLSDGNVDENENYFNFGKISLDDDEVRRVRENKSDIGNKTNYRNEDSYITKRSSSDQFNINGQNSLKPSQTTKIAGDSSQLTEEELAWEGKTSRPGRLDLSKFSQFR